MEKEEIMEITSWENIIATKQEVEPPIEREIGVIGIDYTKINDFAVAGVLTKRGAKFVFKQHTWICASNADLPRIKFPYREAVAAGDAEIVDAPELIPVLIANWAALIAGFYNITMVTLDGYSFSIIKEALRRAGFSLENQNIKLVRQSARIEIKQIIDNGFRNHNIVYGDCPIMRWYTSNTKKTIITGHNAYGYRENEESSLKTNGFFAFVAAMTQHELIPEQQTDQTNDLYERAEQFAIDIMEGDRSTPEGMAILPSLLEVLFRNSRNADRRLSSGQPECHTVDRMGGKKDAIS